MFKGRKEGRGERERNEGGKKKGKEGMKERMKEVIKRREGRNEYVCSCVVVKQSTRLLAYWACLLSIANGGIKIK